MQIGNRRPRAIQQAHPSSGGTAGDRLDVVTADESLSGARADAEPAIASFVAIRTVYFDKLASTLDGAARWIAGKTVPLDRAMVRRVSTSTRTLPLRTFAILLSRLGNGSIYAVLPVLIFARFGKNAIDIIFIATCNIAVLHAFYPALKRRVGRRRPFEVDRQVRSLLNVLDEHSFPSGHIMTLAAALVPVFYLDPGSTAYGSGLLAAMGWARVATGHHYPTDVVAGAVLALVAGYPLTALWFSAY
jgi:undecaprenyl-diphosphatase